MQQENIFQNVSFPLTRGEAASCVQTLGPTRARAYIIAFVSDYKSKKLIRTASPCYNKIAVFESTLQCSNCHCLYQNVACSEFFCPNDGKGLLYSGFSWQYKNRKLLVIGFQKRFIVLPIL